MLRNLPEQDLIAFHAFLYFANMKSKEQFFMGGTYDKKAQTMTALLSIDADGNIVENQAEKGEVTFTLTFSAKKHQAYIKCFGKSKKSSPESRLAHSCLTQITPQLYTQALTLSATQLLIKDNCLANILNLVEHKEIDVFSIFQEVMMPMVVRGDVVKMH